MLPSAGINRRPKAARASAGTSPAGSVEENAPRPESSSPPRRSAQKARPSPPARTGSESSKAASSSTYSPCTSPSTSASTSPADQQAQLTRHLPQPPRSLPRSTYTSRLLMSFRTARVGAGSGEVPGPDALFAAARRVARRGSFMACVLAGCRGEAWLKKGLLSSK